MKKIIFSLVFVLMIGFSFISCNKNDFETYSIEDITQAQYNDAFVKTFGNPASNQDWGFNSRVLPNMTRAAQPNGNQWGTHDDNDKYLDWPQPSPITSDELSAVLAVFNQKEEGPQTALFNFEKFFVQQVYTGPNGYKMNELACVTDWKQTSYWPVKWEQTGNTVDDIVNNFNAGNCTAWNGCMLMWYSSTSQWSFKTSQSGGQRIYDHWRMEQINGNYYIGFDHEAWRQAPANANEEDKRDYIYNDWIIKIVPGNGGGEEPNRYTVRIIAEDLSASTGTDFDFNDVVFDASYKEGSNKTYVTILAAGGTIPLYVNGKEVHDLFAKANPNAGITKTTMINTNAPNGISGISPVSFTIDKIIAPWDIEIAILKERQVIPLKAETGNPAAKIAVDTNFEWCDEREDIKTKYPNFANYVQDTSVNWY